ncbi:MAG: DNA polymerase III subunit delta [Desulfitobacteriaceae bacterium]|nr:DNA polymerase III subunit delta [Desulfitobacteriaceae bacterium]MDD4752400.1 DNA polymerase III subunit delta [Desulfitobacteriaceae bacterium]
MSAVSMVKNSINRGVISPVYLLYGAESYLINQTLDIFYRALVPEGIGDFNYERFDGQVSSPAQVAESAGILPVFAEKRLVVVNHAPWFSSAKSGRDEAPEREVEPLLSYLENPSPSTCLVLVGGEKIDSRKKTVKAIKKTGQVIEFPSLWGSELNSWIEEQFKKQGKKIDRQAMDYLTVAVGNNLSLLAGEIEKTVIYLGDKKQVVYHDVAQVVSPNSMINVFNLVDAVGQRRATTAVRQLREITKTGEQEIKILSLLARQFRILISVQIMEKRGFREYEITKELGLPSFVIKKAVLQCRNFTEEELAEGLEILLDADVAIKTGKGEPLGLLETAILKMCCRKQS